MPMVDRTAAAPYAARVSRLLFVLWLLAATAPAGAQSSALGVQVLASYPHDAAAFTQGLLLHDGALYESTGLVGRSSLRQVEVETGKVLRKVDLPPPLFGEGLAWANQQLIQLTWQNGRALRWDPATFTSRGEWQYEGEGWGLCFDGKALVQSDGSSHLVFRDPVTFAPLRTLAVTDDGQPVTRLNELECVGDTIYANVWMTDRIVAIAAASGAVRGRIDGSGLLTPEERKRTGSEAILNGIAFDPSNNTFLLTGKLWPKLFRVRFVPH